MLKKILVVAMWFAGLAQAWAAVDVNQANDEALRGIKGIGPAKARAIVEEREAHGPYKDTADLARRVSGIGEKSVERLVAEGLTVGAAKAPGATPPAAAARGAAAPAKAAGK
ncbi:ComEA family DNA-binding protein [Burkholderia gladioli]|uniref:Competence ComEA helix-hairpin-helix repeat region domain protein n=1 Tax=Burkholderia gladioli TaxID=28095 RepID=A0AAW3EU74_BURGA|nr:helix-hairpin-helix domain-containing protein [Burkholderia gladioli]AJW97376.1 competence ComEA helix-hairpin-helix repeat region domain protein [Burkholderia gladioli]ASD78402.1 competence protein ComE [Burkholderia gladioli pv. gladioli]AWY56351.1 competence protein ComE [Burkholderia gladioli pv. gladioli]KGC10675.1 competence ComEA helix-hairpin-helix repeat region domain protein [Burkholderia gladioli]PRH02099.1 competence protein ComE [Burkholderia gladioli]